MKEKTMKAKPKKATIDESGQSTIFQTLCGGNTISVS